MLEGKQMLKHQSKYPPVGSSPVAGTHELGPVWYCCHLLLLQLLWPLLEERRINCVSDVFLFLSSPQMNQARFLSET